MILWGGVADPWGGDGCCPWVRKEQGSASESHGLTISEPLDSLLSL